MKLSENAKIYVKEGLLLAIKKLDQSIADTGRLIHVDSKINTEGKTYFEWRQKESISAIAEIREQIKELGV